MCLLVEVPEVLGFFILLLHHMAEATELPRDEEDNITLPDDDDCVA